MRRQRADLGHATWRTPSQRIWTSNTPDAGRSFSLWPTSPRLIWVRPRPPCIDPSEADNRKADRVDKVVMHPKLASSCYTRVGMTTPDACTQKLFDSWPRLATTSHCSVAHPASRTCFCEYSLQTYHVTRRVRLLCSMCAVSVPIESRGAPDRSASKDARVYVRDADSPAGAICASAGCRPRAAAVSQHSTPCRSLRVVPPESSGRVWPAIAPLRLHSDRHAGRIAQPKRRSDRDSSVDLSVDGAGWPGGRRLVARNRRRSQCCDLSPWGTVLSDGSRTLSTTLCIPTAWTKAPVAAAC